MGRWSTVALGALAVALTGHHLAVVFTESVNWDELAFLTRVSDTWRTGQLNGGGRPGLAVLPALPFVAGCDHAIAAARSVRLVWALFTIGYVAGLVEFLRRLLTGLRERPLHDAALGAALLVLVPVWLRWSVQIRTDQGALVCAAWGGVALLASRKRPPLAAVAGLLFGAGLLFTPKAVYAAALFGWLALAECLWRRDFNLRREAMRTAFLALGAIAALVAFRVLIPLFLEPYEKTHSVGRGLDVFAFYRQVLGFRVYRGMLGSLLPQLGLVLAFVLVSVAALRRGDWRGTVAGGGVLVLGLAVGLFHAGAFPYFWMTIGLFPAVVGALAVQPVLDSVPSARSRRLVRGALWAALVVPAVPAGLALLDDTQTPQRDALAFARAHFDDGARGFHPEGALFCRDEPDRFQTFFSQQIRGRFFGPDGAANTRSFLREFATRPVAFLISSYRLQQFPPAATRFWDEHYVRYSPNVFVPGFRVRRDATARLEVIVPGAYRFVPFGGDASARLRLGDRPLEPGQVVPLPAGPASATLTGADAGLLVWAIDEPPSVDAAPFYGLDMRKEFDLGYY